MRAAIVAYLEFTGLTPEKETELLLSMMVAALASLFVIFLTGPFDPDKVDGDGYPPAPVRLGLVMENVLVWAGQSGQTHVLGWLNRFNFQNLLTIGSGGYVSRWKDEVAFLNTDRGRTYVHRLMQDVNDFKLSRRVADSE